MIDRPPGNGEPPIPDDPFLAEDPAAREREARRRERERKRAERAAREAEREPRPGGADAAGREGPREPGPAGPSPAERASAAISGLGERISKRRAERATRASADSPREPDQPSTTLPKRSVTPVPEGSDPSVPAERAVPGVGAGDPPATGVPREPTAPRGALLRRLPHPSPVLVVIAVFAIAALIFLNALFQPFHGGGGERVLFKVPKGAAAGEVADRLDEEGVITSGTLFEVRLTLSGRRGDIFAGTYSLEEGMSYSDAIDELTKPPGQRTLPVTIPEGYSREQIARIATDAGLEGSYERESRSAKGFDSSRYGAEQPESLEGFLYPATYELKPNDSAADLVSEQLAAFEKEFRKVDIDFAESKNLTPYDVLTIASMIDREVMIPDERRLVSSVIYNRLEQGEPLGIDATIRYATGNYDQPLTESELAIDSPFNTRTNAGLPPTPIGNPGLEAIKAAADPADTDFLYYVVKPGTCGEHEFVDTQEEFDAATARYDSAREAAGGKSPDTC
jgi:UPF0755 protein